MGCAAPHADALPPCTPCNLDYVGTDGSCGHEFPEPACGGRQAAARRTARGRPRPQAGGACRHAGNPAADAQGDAGAAGAGRGRGTRGQSGTAPGTGVARYPADRRRTHPGGGPAAPGLWQRARGAAVYRDHRQGRLPAAGPVHLDRAAARRTGGGRARSHAHAGCAILGRGCSGRGAASGTRAIAAPAASAPLAAAARLVLALALCAGAWQLLHSHAGAAAAPPAAHASALRYHAIASTALHEQHPSLSPDGGQVVYSRETRAGGPRALYCKRSRTAVRAS
jgi:hypothetical protein